MLDGALALARAGVPVIPLRPRSKIPRHARWTDLGLLDEAAIRQEWTLEPDANVGVLGGRDAFDGAGLTIVDLDEPDGIYNWNTLADDSVADYATVSTPSGGLHAYFRGATDSWNPAPNVEVRSVGRQCAAPPSTTRMPYTWWMGFPGNLEELPPLPAWAIKPPDAYRPPRVTDVAARDGSLDDPVLRVPPPVYFRVLTGLVPNRQGFVCCPLHQENTPSCRVYPTAEQGWYCYGHGCQKGGDVITLAAELAGLERPVRGRAFVALLTYLHHRLLA
jgi:hypothetical protein